MADDDLTPWELGNTAPFELASRRIGALPIVDRFLDRLQLHAVLERHLPPADARASLSVARTIGVLVRNLCVAREPVYGLGEWARQFEPALLGLADDNVELLNDDRVGRALDKLFDADRAALLCDLIVGAISEFGIDCSQLHNDSTSVTLYGSFADASGRARGKSVAMPARGHCKDHRPDLKQLVLILTVSADGAVPIVHRLVDGNTTDDTTHIETWDSLCTIVGRADFLYVADSKLCTGPQMRHIDTNAGRFVTILPRTRKEESRLREWAARSTPAFIEAERRPARRQHDPDEVWSTAIPPFVSAEGFQLVLVHSTAKQRRDETGREDRIARAIKALDAYNERLAGPRARATDLATVNDTVEGILSPLGVDRYITCTITPYTQESFRQESRGRPGKDTRYRKTLKDRFRITHTIDTDAIRFDAASDGCFPLITNDAALEPADVLAAYRYQPNLEKRHHELKGVMDAAPVTLHNDHRIEALFACQFIALLCRCLIERHLRAAMANTDTRLALYHEDRDCTAPTAARIFDAFHDTTRHQLTLSDSHIQTFHPDLTPLQQQLLDLLDIPTDAYTN